MIVIENISIRRFRSIEKADINGLSDYNAIAGLNSSGKSNLLRAISLFFTGFTEPGKPFDQNTDYLFSRSRIQKKTEISIKFCFPNNFNLNRVPNIEELLIDRKIEIKKVWTLKTGDSPIVFLVTTTGEEELTGDRLRLFNSLLSLIRFRYIKARFEPEQIIKEIMPRIIRHLSKQTNRSMKDGLKAQSNKILDIIKSHGKKITGDLNTQIKKGCPGVSGIDFEIPKQYIDLLKELHFIIPITRWDNLGIESLGSGTQAFLTYLITAFADTRFDLDFGWKQAAIWAIEEPETSAHYTLNIIIGNYFKDLTSGKKSRVQLFVTTHSQEIIKSADKGILIKLDDNKSQASIMGAKKLSKESLKLGVGVVPHPLITLTDKPIIIPEGKYDEVYLKRAAAILGKEIKGEIICLENLTSDIDLGGDTTISNYLKYNKAYLHYRPLESPIIALYDWETNDGKVKSVNKIFNKHHQSSIAIIQPKEMSNPSLTDNWRGIERFLGDRIIEELLNKDIIKIKFLTDKDGKNRQYEITRKELKSNKENIFEHIGKMNLNSQDMVYFGKLIDFINKKIEDSIKTANGSLLDN